MPGSTLDQLPKLRSPTKKTGGRSWARRLPAAKPVLPVVEIKKALKLLKGAGKSLAAIELLSGGGFRVVASAHGVTKDQPPPEPKTNPWDEILDE